MTKKDRIVAFLAAAALLLVLLASSAFIIVHAHHDCTGEDCPVCTRIEACTERVRQLAAAVVTAAAAAAAAAFLRTDGAACLRPARPSRTPVSLKVKLSH